jgi:hypothetical protein
MAKKNDFPSKMINKKNASKMSGQFWGNTGDAVANLKVLFPQATVYSTKNGSIKIEYNSNFVNKFNNNLNKGQVFLDNKVIMALQRYVSKKYGIQEASIRYGSLAGSGKVHINVPYAHYQAYSPKIKKRAGLRGTKPWERMVADNKDSILRQVARYSKGLNT